MAAERVIIRYNVGFTRLPTVVTLLQGRGGRGFQRHGTKVNQTVGSLYDASHYLL
jgi:hypothetical protein